MSSIADSNKRIAKNTLILYFRTGITLLVSLYTSRVILNALGIEDFGIYNVVGGVLVLFAFLNAAMSGATQRFLNFELGRNDIQRAKDVFSASFFVHLGIAVFVLFLAETIGLWYLNATSVDLFFFDAKLKIPEARMDAANWIFQFAVLSTMLSIMTVPYRATIIAYEKMGFYGYLSILESLMKLAVALIIANAPVDKLKLYGVLLFAVTLLAFALHVAYCKMNFKTVQIQRLKDPGLLREILGFSGWSLAGSSANVFRDQGLNVLFNIFCGVTYNAAMGIVNQVNSAVYSFVSNFQMSFNPQLVKRYSAGEHESFIRLIFQSAKISFFLMMLVSMPILLNTEYILQIWLGIFPPETPVFIQLTFLFMLVESLSGPLWISVQATGKIRNYQLLVASFNMLNIPIALCLLCSGFDPACVLLAKVIVNFFILCWRVFYLKSKISLPAFRFFFEVIVRCLIVMSIAFVLLREISSFMSGFHGFVALTVLSVFVSIVLVWIFGFNRNERKYMVQFVRKKKENS